MKELTLRAAFLLCLLVATVGLVAGVAGPARASADWATQVDPELVTATAGGTAEFLIVLDEQADLSGASRFRDKAERGRYVYDTMTTLAARTQAPLRALLEQHGATYRSYWVSNLIWVRGDRDVLRAVASRGDVRHVYANTWQHVQVPQPDATPIDWRARDLIEWNIEIVHAPEVWQRGFTGQGVVIGGQDTGYAWDHPAIKNQYRGWDGATADHNYNWHDAIREDNPLGGGENSCGFDLAAPCDDDGHGTHTMGTMVGETPELNIGMAPGAEWIGCRNMEEGWGSPSTYTECYEWFIAPYPIGGDPFTDGEPAKAPHVINNSWACPAVEGCTTLDVLQQVVETVRAAGIITVHSAGNKGPNCATVSEPAGIYDASFTVGATNDQNLITGFSSRGPVAADGSDRLKPDIVAPGQGILSSIPLEINAVGYAFLSGTSMAAPHVTGLVALLISAEPDLAGRVTALEDVITQSALKITSSQNCGSDNATSVPNNVYGWGRIDALAAYELLGTEVIDHDMFLPVLIPR